MTAVGCKDLRVQSTISSDLAYMSGEGVLHVSDYWTCKSKEREHHNTISARQPPLPLVSTDSRTEPRYLHILQMTTANTEEDEETGILPADARMSAINISKFARAKSTLTSWWVIYLNFA